MADDKITRDVYRQYAHKIASVLDNEEFFEQFKKRVDSGASSFKLGKKRLIQDISIDWISTIEEILPNLDTIVRNPRRFIVQEEDIVDVSLARSISTESVKFLAQHTNMISKVEDDGSVIPSKILNITKEESFEIYENRFIYTLLLKLKDFVTMRYDKIKKASATQDVLELDVESRFNLPSKKVTFRTEYFAQLSFDEIMRLDPDTLTKIERVAKIDRIVTDFLSSSFAKSMRNSAPVRPPIMRTNVILKEPNFKKALVLWQFIETYNQTAGFSTTDEVEDLPLENESVENLRNMVTLNTMLFESMYEEYETDMNMEDKQFADFLRVGEMDFEKDKLERDQYAQKLEEKIENEEEEQNIEEVKAQEEEEAQQEIPPEPEEKTQTEENQVVQEQEVEKPVEVERLKEMPPKAEQEEVDLEPDAEKFDQHLYDVRKLYKRPDDDKLKQEDIVKVRDAIDRCLTSYRRIKQEELDERERQERIRRRKADMAKRAEALDKQREELSLSVGSEDSSYVYFGMDPFSYQKAKLAAEKKEEERLKLDKDEKLELEGDIDAIAKQMDEMDAARASAYASATKQAASAEQAEKAQKKPAKRKMRISKNSDTVDPWGAKREFKEFAPIDETKVQVGGIHFADGSDIENPFGELLGVTTNRAENRPDRARVEHSDEDEVKAPSEEVKPTPKKKRRKKKATPAEASELAAEENKSVETAPETSDETAPIETAETPVETTEMPIESVETPVETTETPAETVEETVENPEEPVETAETSTESEETPAEENADINEEAEETLLEEETPAESEEAQTETEETPTESEETPTESEETPTESGEAPVESDETSEEQETPIEAHAEEQHEETESPTEGQEPLTEEQEAPTEEKEAPTEAPEEEKEASAEAPEEEGEKAQSSETKPEKKKRAKRAKGELSPTTTNQKYSKPSGKAKDVKAVDESKVQVGGIRFAKGSGLDDPFGMDPFATRSSRAKSNDDSDEDL